MAERPMDERQRRFADFYVETNNAEQSAIRAGYSPRYARGNAHKLVARSCIGTYIEKRNKQLESDRIAKMTEVKQFWTEVLRDNAAEMKDRLKASEHLAKSNGAFLDRTELTGPGGGPVQIEALLESLDDS